MGLSLLLSFLSFFLKTGTTSANFNSSQNISFSRKLLKLLGRKSVKISLNCWMILVGISLDKVAFLQFNVLAALELSSLVTFLKEKNFVFARYVWVNIIVRIITFTGIIIKHIYTKIRNNINKIVIESIG